MLTLWGNKQPFCDGISRRQLLRIGALANVSNSKRPRGTYADGFSGAPIAGRGDGVRRNLW